MYIYIIVYVPIRPVRSLSDPVLLSNYIIYNYIIMYVYIYIKKNVCVCESFLKPSLTVPIGSASSATHSKTYACASLYTKI